MSLPNLSFTDVEAIVPNCKVVGTPSGGGQKLVFPCEIRKICAEIYIFK